ncbi:MAG: biotin/lipoyl-binding protein [Bacteroidia bacterium]|nr:biotin/lipoyl-binding protein [Bacteroidia bacterium]
MYQVKVNNREVVEARISDEGQLQFAGQEMKLDLNKLGEKNYHVLFGNKSFRVQVLKANKTTKTYTIKVGSNRYEISLADKYDLLLKKLGMAGVGELKVNDLKAPMPGLVVDVLVKEGQDIKKGDPILVLEAMKMENILKAVSDATVKSVSVAKGSKVEKNETLVALK